MHSSPRLLRFLRRGLVGLAVVATALALAVAVENWRGSRAWRLYAEEQAARGVDLTTLPAPTSIPDAVNFMRAPVFERFFARPLNEADRQEFSAKFGFPTRRSGPAGAAWQDGRRLELADCIYALTTGPKPSPDESRATPTRELAERLLALQQPGEELLQEMRRAAQERPESQFVRRQPMDVRDPFAATSAPFFYVRHLVTAQVWHASAAMATDRADAALYDVLAGLKLLRGVAEAPDALLVDTMIGTAGTGLVMQAVWEGLQGGKWSEPQLAALGVELARADLVASLRRSLHNDRVAGNVSIDQLGWWRDSPTKRMLRESSSNELAWLLYFPAGWIQQNKLRSNQWLDQLLGILAACATPGFHERLHQVSEPMADAGGLRAPYRLLTASLMTTNGKVVPAVVYRQTCLQLAGTACALERFRLAHDRYPARLDELVPAFLDKVPVDLVDGQPLRYRRDDVSGRFALYSLGYDGKDDGGRSPLPAKPGETPRATEPGDWIWPQPADQAR